MNKHVQRVESRLLVSISELKKNPSAVIAAAENAPIAVLNHNKVTAYIIAPEVYEEMLDRIEDAELNAIADERANDPLIEVSLDEL
jgi:antitoxin StbD